MSLFGFDASTPSLVYPDPVTSQPRFVRVSELVAMGWQANEVELRNALPRFGKPLIQSASMPVPKRIR